jgi:hypothetical protein
VVCDDTPDDGTDAAVFVPCALLQSRRDVRGDNHGNLRHGAPYRRIGIRIVVGSAPSGCLSQDPKPSPRGPRPLRGTVGVLPPKRPKNRASRFRLSAVSPSAQNANVMQG